MRPLLLDLVLVLSRSLSSCSVGFVLCGSTRSSTRAAWTSAWQACLVKSGFYEGIVASRLLLSDLAKAGLLHTWNQALSPNSGCTWQVFINVVCLSELMPPVVPRAHKKTVPGGVPPPRKAFLVSRHGWFGTSLTRTCHMTLTPMVSRQ